MRNTLTDTALRAFQSEWHDITVEGNSVGGYLVVRDNGKRFCFTAISELFGPYAWCPLELYRIALKDGRGMLISYRGHTYLFDVRRIGVNSPTYGTRDDVRIVKFPMRLGMSVRTLTHPVTRKIGEVFNAKITTE